MKFKMFVVIFLGLLAFTGCSGKSEEKSKESVAPKTEVSSTPSAAAPAPVITSYDATLSEGIQFGSKPGYPKFIKSVSGVSGYEPPNGRWTDGKTAVFTFNSPLPESFKLHLEISGVFGPNVGKPVKVNIGDWEGEFTVKPGIPTFDLSVKTSQQTESITMTIPEPTSPKELKMSDDPRLLGIFLKNLSINEIPTTQE